MYAKIKEDDEKFEGAAGKEESGGERQGSEDDEEAHARIFQVSLNRRASTALETSVPAVKADAARTLFKVKCDKIVWAVLDAGIHEKHDAFITSEGQAARQENIRLHQNPRDPQQRRRH